MIRALVADDSATVRKFLRHTLETSGQVEVVGEAVDGPGAVERTRTSRPDIVIMDVHMPGFDGLEATERIMQEVPTPIIIVSGVGDDRDVALSVRATAAGALTALAKPRSLDPDASAEFRHELLFMTRAMSQVKVVRRRPSLPYAGPASALSSGAGGPLPVVPTVRRGPAEVVVIGASTGGPVALREILGALPGDFPVPILLVQHIARGFVGGFCEWLRGTTPLRVAVAEPLDRLEGGAVFVAPDDRHLVLHSPRLAGISAAPPVERFRPSIDVLFESAARVRGAASVGLILTGMGADGVRGARAIRDTNGYVLAQDEETSVVFGMAKEAGRAGAVEEFLPVGKLAARLLQLVEPVT